LTYTIYIFKTTKVANQFGTQTQFNYIYTCTWYKEIDLFPSHVWVFFE